MSSCVGCGSPLPSSQGSSTCSMCYGDPYHGSDGYYLRMLEEDAQKQDYERWLDSQHPEDDSDRR